MGGGNKTVYLPNKHWQYAIKHIEDFSLYVRTKIEEDMENNISYLEKKIETMELQKTLLRDKIKKLKKMEEDRTQRLNELIEKTEGRKGETLRKWAEGWRGEIVKCGLSIDQFIKIVEKGG